MKLFFKILFRVILVLFLLVLGYLSYFILSYKRIEDNLVLPVSSTGSDKLVKTEEVYDVISFNIGFGAYEPDYGFFMDGGDQSWAWSKDRLLANMSKIGKVLHDSGAQFINLQEVDTNSTRTYHVNEVEILESYLSFKSSVFGINYNSPFLMYPVSLRPHGKSVSGLLSFSDFNFTSSVRYSLPIQGGFMKFVDLDRCYTVSRIKVENGKELVLYNLHLTAYTSDGEIVHEQFKRILSDMQKEYEAGNYCLACGDFNKDLVGDKNNEYLWAQKVDLSLFKDKNLTLIAPYDPENVVYSCRNADGPLNPDQFQVTLDGFIVSDNISVISSSVIDTNFAYSDHNPVRMSFFLNK